MFVADRGRGGAQAKPAPNQEGNLDDRVAARKAANRQSAALSKLRCKLNKLVSCHSGCPESYLELQLLSSIMTKCSRLTAHMSGIVHSSTILTVVLHSITPFAG